MAAVHPEVIDGHAEYLDQLVQLTPGLFWKSGRPTPAVDMDATGSHSAGIGTVSAL